MSVRPLATWARLAGTLLHRSHPSEHAFACLPFRTGVPGVSAVVQETALSYSAICRSRACPHRSAPRRRPRAGTQRGGWAPAPVAFCPLQNLPVSYLMTVTISQGLRSVRTAHRHSCFRTTRALTHSVVFPNHLQPRQLSTPFRYSGHGGPMEEVHSGKCTQRSRRSQALYWFKVM